MERQICTCQVCFYFKPQVWPPSALPACVGAWNAACACRHNLLPSTPGQCAMQALRGSQGACCPGRTPPQPACHCDVRQRLVRHSSRPARSHSGHAYGTWPSRSCKGRSAVHIACKAAHVGADGAAAGPRKTVEGASEDIGVIWSRLVKVSVLYLLPLTPTCCTLQSLSFNEHEQLSSRSS